MPITFTIPNVIANQSGPNVNASLLDDNWSAIRTALSGVAISASDVLAGAGISVAVGGAQVTVTATGTMPRSYLAGLGLANNASDATNDIDIAVGAARDSTNAEDIALASALTKQLDATWVVGTNQGMRDGGTIANASYHLFLIKRSDTDVVDVLASLNNDATATITMTIASPGVVTWANHGLQAGSSVIFTTTGALPTGVTAGTRYYVISTGLTTSAFQFSATEGGSAVNTSGTQSGTHTGTAAPIMPTNYDYRRRIGSIVRTGGAIKAFTQQGDYVRWAAAVLDVDATNAGTSAVTRTLTVPVGINVFALFNGRIVNSAATEVVYFSDLAATDEAPASAGAPLSSLHTEAAGGAASGQIEIRTSVAAQIRSRQLTGDANCNLRVATLGYFDRRGRDL